MWKTKEAKWKRLDNAAKIFPALAGQEDSDKALYSYALEIEKGGPLESKSIRDSGIRDNYDCMVLGLQRENLPLAQPDINMVMQSGDLVWILGSSSMADKVLKA